jgi:NAD-dependent deacetylase
MSMKKILIFTGAGVSKESGVETFRDSDGLWYNFKIEDVATLTGWRKDKNRVLDFYNQRRAQMKDVYPNDAHKIIAELEKDYNVTLVTQNVDNLHERAGSTNVIHLHGELSKAKSSFPGSDETFDWEGDINIGDKCSKGSQLRPAVVWFGESLNYNLLSKAEEAAQKCDICIIVGTSMQVAPANLLPTLVKDTCKIYYVDPADEMIVWSDSYGLSKINYTHIKEPATVGMKKIVDILKNV